MSLRLLLAAVLLLCACGGRTGLQDPGPTAGPGRDGGERDARPEDAGSEDGGPALDLSPDGALPLLVPVATVDREVIDVDDGQLVFASDRYGVLWTENRRGRLQQRLAILDLEGRTLQPSRRLTELEDVAEAQLVFTGGGLGFFYVAAGVSYLQALDRDGLPSGAPARLPGVDVGPDRGRALFVSPYHALLWSTADPTPQLSLALVEIDGSLRQEPMALGELNAAVRPIPAAVGHGATFGTYYAAPWVARGDQAAGQPDDLVLARFTESGALAADIQLLWTSTTLHLGTGGALARGDRAFVGAWDYGSGVRLFRTGGPAPWQALVPEMNGRPALAANDELTAVVSTRGDPRPSTVPGELVLGAFEPDGQPEVTPLAVVNPGFTDRGACIEHHTVAAGRDRTFAVLWREGCGGPRTLYFRRLTAESP